MSLEARGNPLPDDLRELLSSDPCNGLGLGSDGFISYDDRYGLGFHSDRQLNNQLWDTDADNSQEVALRSVTITNPSSCRDAIVSIRVWHGKIWFRDTANVGDFTIRYYPRVSHNLTATPPTTAGFDSNYSIGYMHPAQAGRDNWACMEAGWTERIVTVGGGGSVSATIGGLFVVPRPASVVSQIRYYIWKESISMSIVSV